MNGSAINAPTPLSRGRLRFKAPLVLLVGLTVAMLAVLAEVDDRFWQRDAAR